MINTNGIGATNNHHFIGRDTLKLWMTRCVMKKIQGGKTKTEAYNICNMEYHTKKNTKLNDNIQSDKQK